MIRNRGFQKHQFSLPNVFFLHKAGFLNVSSQGSERQQINLQQSSPSYYEVAFRQWAVSKAGKTNGYKNFKEVIILAEVLFM